ncbi:MAG TPA: efflux RND transporter periplasmic adaptor subunit [Thermoanaerobaculia bacterium]|jgi:membrane fusion protein (multidrug efflux system)|nr:efflux RND transporter periplasmic adaptor subunit [Thermoanaerobaculia bacterium]
MTKRMLLMLAVVITFLAIIGGFKFFQIRTAMAQQGSFQPPPEAVTTTVAKLEMWDTTLNAIGTVVAVNGVTVSADLPGIVEHIAFDSGQWVNKGDVLVRLDTKQERAQLAAADAARELARLDLERKQGLRAKDVIPQSLYDQVAAESKQAEARAGEIRATIERKTIRAPFAGVLGIRQVNLGQYLAGGAPIVSLQALRPVYVNFNVPQQESLIRPGTVVVVRSDGFQGVETGKIAATDSLVDEATRNVQVQAVFDNRSGKLRPGMFVEAQLARGVKTATIALPASAISYAPFGDSVFIVEDVKGPNGKTYRGVRQQFVKLAGSRGDQVGVVTGVKPGEEVVTSGVFKLRPGAAVQVNNAIQPGNSPAPKPEDS